MQVSTKRILIIERNPHVRDFLRRELVKRDYLVRGSRHADEALAVVSSPEPPDLIVFAADTPDIDTAGELQRLSWSCPRTPIILHTYHEDSVDESIAPFVTAVVEKSGNPERLLQIVDDLLCRKTNRDDPNGREGR
jgi:DNA-binding NtrC family response regulator